MASEPSAGWGELAGRVANEFGLRTQRSPTLKSAIEKGVRYVVVDTARQEIVFDARCLFLGLLVAGQYDRDSIDYGNTASWFFSWLDERFESGQLAKSLSQADLTAPEDVFSALEKGYSVILSESVKGLLPSAAKFSQETIGSEDYEARHLFAAMIQRQMVLNQVEKTLHRTLTDEQLLNLKQTLVGRILPTAQPVETRDAWLAAFDIPASTDTPREPASTSRPPADLMTGIEPDSACANRDDVIGVLNDARAIARLMCLEKVAPLAIAIFGGWGSGKSTFMDYLDEEVRGIASGARESSNAKNDSAPKFVRRIVQMRFNAWQFVDANLWASLTAEFFDQLRAGGWDRTNKTRYAGLVEKVNNHVHSLAAEAELRRKAAAQGSRDVAEAQKARDKAAQDARNAQGRELSEAALDSLSDAFGSQKLNLAKLGLSASDDSMEAVGAFLRVVKSTGSLIDQSRSMLELMEKSSVRRFLFWFFVGLLLGSVILIVFWRSPLFGIAGVLTSIGALVPVVAPALAIIAGVTQRVGDLAGAVKASDEKTSSELLKKEIDLRNAMAEADALQSAAVRADRSLARYVDPAGASNPPRLLRYVLEDDPDTKALESQLGLIGRTRRLFRAVDDIVREEREKESGRERDDQVPDRIVLYIDDLDRCTEDQIYSVLQAIHLLLAFESFVVVVGVDVKAVQNALAKGLGTPLSSQPYDLTRSRSIAYLEKIFQIAFWLNPLDAGEGNSFGRYVRSLAGPREAEIRSQTSERTEATRVPPPFHPSLTGAPDQFEPPALGSQIDPEVRPPVEQLRSTPVPALETLQLTKPEIDFLASPTIAAVAATTPRAVKRLVNTYRLVRARIGAGSKTLSDDAITRIYPIIALTVAIETGQPVEVADAFYEGLNLLKPSESVCQNVFFLPASRTSDDKATKRMAMAFSESPGLVAAVQMVYQLRDGHLIAGDVLKVAKLARRFSFNHFH